jgi:hypothetical protein
LLLAGCYSPSPPSGAYLCGPSNACPSSQSCVCGQCVNKPGDAACAFSVDAMSTPPVAEHQGFQITIKALQADMTTPASYNGNVSLAFLLRDGSLWCDVTPSTVPLTNGTASPSISLNRETIPPQTPLLTVTGPAGSTGSTGHIVVYAPPLVKDVNPIVPPSGMGTSFGWADQVAAEPVVVKSASGYNMYFTGFGSRSIGIGVATSTDGKSFTPQSAPILTPTPGTFYSMSVFAPAVMQTSSGWTMLFSGSDMGYNPNTSSDQIGMATSADGVSGWSVGNGGKPVLRHRPNADCVYCDASLDFPALLPQAANADGGSDGAMLFFAARQCANAACDSNSLVSIARATLDGTTWVPEPAPVLQGDVGGEALLLAPSLMLDGSVYKMWYSFARLKDVSVGADLCSGVPMFIGYATSTDGLYWVRSPSNRNALGPTAGTWDSAYTAMLVGSAIPLDGVNPSSGVAIYYSPWKKNVLNICAPNGIGRATRP